jgi:phosphatidylinositol alpha-mannosyltransferase
VRKLKIAQVCPYSLSIPGGVREHILALTKEFRRLGHRVTVIAPGEAEPPPIEGVATFGRTVPIFTLNGSQSVITLYNEALWESLEEFLDRESFDIVHIHTPSSPFLNWQILYAAKTTIVATFHTDFDWGIFSQLVQQSFLKAINIFFSAKIDGSIAVSKIAKKFAKRCFRSGDRIIPNGVDTQRFCLPREPVDKKGVKVLFVGRMEKRKGLPYLIRAIAQLPTDWPMELEIVGNGPERGEVEDLVDELNLREKMTFLGQVSDEEIPGHYRQAGVFCSPAVGAESQGIVLLEAMASGLPLVVFANPGYRELLSAYPEKKCLVEPGNTEGLAQALALLIQDEELRLRLGRWGREKSLAYDWSKIAQEVLSFYEVVMARRRVEKERPREFAKKILIPLQERFLKAINGARERLEKNLEPLFLPP